MLSTRRVPDLIRDRLTPRVGQVAGALVVLVILLIPALLLARGYFPTDDCLRHAAKAVDGRPWAEILVLRPGILEDPHTTWHGLLRCVHLATDCGVEGLILLTVAGLFALVLLAPLPWLRAPEAWLGAWVFAWISGGGQMRLLLGRPFLVAMGCLVFLMTLWTRDHARGPARRWWLTLALFCAAALFHGSWYLLALIPLAFLLAQRWREARGLLLAWICGSLLAGVLTGHPIAFLGGQLLHMRHAMAPLATAGPMVTEFAPSMGSGAMGMLLLGFLCFKLGGEREGTLLGDPIFLLALVGWLLGLQVQRFWVDWGLPCAVLWLAFELEPRVLRFGSRAPVGRLVLAAGTCLAALLLVTTADDRRWSERTHENSIVTDRPELRGWLPGDGGILYAAHMAIFYDTFYRNPHAPWRYILGFEPAMMPDEDRATFQKVVTEYDNPAAFRPWLAKMRPVDRLAYFSGPSPRALFPGLQWYPVGRNIWLGRLPSPLSSPGAAVRVPSNP